MKTKKRREKHRDKKRDNKRTGKESIFLTNNPSRASTPPELAVHTGSRSARRCRSSLCETLAREPSPNGFVSLTPAVPPNPSVSSQHRLSAPSPNGCSSFPSPIASLLCRLLEHLVNISCSKKQEKERENKRRHGKTRTKKKRRKEMKRKEEPKKEEKKEGTTKMNKSRN